VPRSYGYLTGEQAEHFLERGFVTVQGAFEPADAQQWLENAWTRFGYDRHDPASWAEKRIHLSSRSHVDARTFAPAAWGAAIDLVGGESRVTLPWQWGDGFIANLGVGDDRPWQPPSRLAGGWHKDGDFFRHFLDSAEQALLTFVLWTNATSQNVLGVGRIITNPPLALRQPMSFRRPHVDDFSLVERAVLRGLGVDRLDFVPTAPRENVVPERVRRQQARAIAENARLAAVRRTM
jgi:hypothetical protein